MAAEGAKGQLGAAAARAPASAAAAAAATGPDRARRDGGGDARRGQDAAADLLLQDPCDQGQLVRFL